jgi:tRNA dimethylallyltransferase
MFCELDKSCGFRTHEKSLLFEIVRVNSTDRSDHGLIFLAGSTASGKTDLAIELAARLPVDLISVDSSQVYQGLDIGTAKPEGNILEEIPHGLVDIRSVRQPFSAADFCLEAGKLIDSAFEKGRIPLLVGGTMFYFAALLHGLSDLPPANPALRARLVKQAKQRGWPFLHGRLEQVDPQAAQRIDRQDAQRISRALEINFLTGLPVPVEATGNGLIEKGVKVTRLSIFIPDRQLLHQRISKRLQRMLDDGLVEEVEKLREQWPQGGTTPALRSVGYRQVWEYLEGQVDYSTMVERAGAATRRLAKRQLTWLRNEPGITWFDGTNPTLVTTLCRYLEARGVIAGGTKLEKRP